MLVRAIVALALVLVSAGFPALTQQPGAAPAESENSHGYNALAGIGAVKLDDGRLRVVMLVGENKGRCAGVTSFPAEDFEHLM